MALLLNGLACKDLKMVDANDFSSSGIHIAGNTSNPAGSKVTPMTAAQIPGLNSLDISLVHIDYAPWGINPPHTHPRATEILTVLEGSLEVGFVTSNPQNRLITKVLQKGDVFVFPIGLPGLNSLDISLVRIDYAPWGINPPHTHPRAIEILTVLEGSLEVGFVTSNPQNRLITKVLQKGDVFEFPIGLIHYQRNFGNGSAIAIAALSNQNPGVITIANAVFGFKPHISSDILVKAFQVDNNVINYIQSKFKTSNDYSINYDKEPTSLPVFCMSVSICIIVSLEVCVYCFTVLLHL